MSLIETMARIRCRLHILPTKLIKTNSSDKIGQILRPNQPLKPAKRHIRNESGKHGMPVSHGHLNGHIKMCDGESIRKNNTKLIVLPTFY